MIIMLVIMLMVAKLSDAQAIHKHLKHEPGDPLKPDVYLSVTFKQNNTELEDMMTKQ